MSQSTTRSQPEATQPDSSKLPGDRSFMTRDAEPESQPPATQIPPDKVDRGL